MTNNHVLDSKETCKNATTQFFYEEGRELIKIGFDVESANSCFITSETPDSKGKKPLEKNKLDYTIVTLKDHPELKKIYKRFFSIFECQKFKIKEGDSANIIQHPNEKKGEEESSYKIISYQKNCVVDTKGYPYTILYKTKTKKGSSGSPVFDDEGRLYGLHRRRIDEDNNAAISMKAILKDLKSPEKKEEFEAIKPLMPEDSIAKQISQDLLEKLKQRYLANNKILIFRPAKNEEEDWELKLPIKEIYTRLALITDIEKKEKDKELKEDQSNEVKDGRIPTYETLFEPKEEIDLDGLFDIASLKTKERKRILILGVAGIGKSTFCIHITYRWALGDLWPEYKTLLLVRFRDLNGIQYPARSIPYTIEDVIEKECDIPSSFLKNKELLSRTLLILDGYDEHSYEEKDKHLYHIFEEFKEKFPHILMTSRPQIVPFGNDICKLEILGFDTKSINIYSERFFIKISTQTKEITLKEAEEKTKRLKNLLKHQPLIKSLAHIPINLTFLCSLFVDDENILQSEVPFTITSLYDRMTTWLYKRFLLKEGSIPSDKIRQTINPCIYEIISNSVKALEKIAWIAMKQNRFYLSQEEIEKILILYKLDLSKVEELGLLRIENKMGDFIHPSFQEFFTAVRFASFYLDDILREKRQKFIQENKFNPRYSMVFWMIAGYLSTKKLKALQAFFNDLFSDPRDFAMSYELNLLARCFEECLDPSKISQYRKFIENTANYICQVSNPISIYRLLHHNPKLFHHSNIANAIIENLSNKEKEKSTLKLLKMIVKIGYGIPPKIWSFLDKTSLISSTNFNLVINLFGKIAKTEQMFAKEAMEKLSRILKNKTSNHFFIHYAIEAIKEIEKAGQILPEKIVKGLIQNLDKSSAKILEKIVKGRQPCANMVIEELAQIIKESKPYHFHIKYAVRTLEKIAETKQMFAKEALEKLSQILEAPKINAIIKNSIRIFPNEINRKYRLSSLVSISSSLEPLVPNSIFPMTPGKKTRWIDPSLSKIEVEDFSLFLTDPTINFDTKLRIFLSFLKKKQPSSNTIIDELTQIIKDPKNIFYYYVKIPVVEFLGEIARETQKLPKEAKEAIKGLIDIIFDTTVHSDIRFHVIQVLENVKKKRIGRIVIEELIEILKDPNENFNNKDLTIKALEKIIISESIFAKEIIKERIKLINNIKSHSSIRFILYALRRHRIIEKIFGKEILEELIGIMKDCNFNLFVGEKETSLTLANMDKEQQMLIIELLLELIHNPNKDIQENIIQIFKKSTIKNQKFNEKVVQKLFEVLKNLEENLYIKAYAAKDLREWVEISQKVPDKVLNGLVDILGITDKNFDLNVDNNALIIQINITKTIIKMINTGQIFPMETIEKLISFLNPPNMNFYTQNSAVDILETIAKNKQIFNIKTLEKLVEIFKIDMGMSLISTKILNILDIHAKVFVSKQNDNLPFIIEICFLTGNPFFRKTT